MFDQTPDAKTLKGYEKLLSVETLPRLNEAPSKKDRESWLGEIGKLIKEGRHHIFLDPNTGIRRKDTPRTKSTAYIWIDEISTLLKGSSEVLIVCFDQSFSRGSVEDLKEARAEKLRELEREEIFACYYGSHASFLAASQDRAIIEEWKRILIERGIPKERFQPQD